MHRFARWQTWLTAAFVLLCLLLASASWAQQSVPVPPWKTRVVDLVGLLQPDQQHSLEAQLESLEKTKGSQVGMLIVPTTGNETIEQFGIRVMDSWKPGRKTVDGQRIDDGLLIIVATTDRKMRIEVGYGLEGAIPDVMAKRILDKQMTPSFRQGDYFGGLQRAVSSVTSLINGEDLPAPRPQQTRGDDSIMSIGIAVFVGFVVGSIVIAIAGRFFGTVIGMIAAGGMASSLLATFSAIAISAFGTFFVLGMFRNDDDGPGGWRRVGPHTYRRRGPVIWGGGFGGGGGGFGGGGGGGFGGGFGGGGGGGGASGGW